MESAARADETRDLSKIIKPTAVAAGHRAALPHRVRIIGCR
jgi:hypothetical protein